MPCQQHKDSLERWWNDRLTDAERAELEAQLMACEDCRRELEGSRELWELMGHMPVPEPSDDMQVQFNAMLASYKTTVEASNRPSALSAIWQLFAVRPAMAMAFSIVLLLAGFGVGMMLNRAKTVVVHDGAQGTVATTPSNVLPSNGTPATGTPATGTPATVKSPDSGVAVSPNKVNQEYHTVAATDKPATNKPASDNPTSDKPGSESKQLAELTAQMHEMRELMMLSLLQNPAASERIRAVSYTSEIRRVNPNIAAALLATLNNDPNVNVRLTTLEALTHFARDPAVRQGLIQSILQQDSPLVQAALADVMLKLQEKRAIEPFKKLLQEKDLNGSVRLKVEKTITQLS